MEQLVLGIFQEQLGKVIIGFRKEQVNANLLNGKGEIRDVSLNCAVLNDAIARVCPYVRMEEIHVSRIGFHVTSWTNLRKAPIIVDIGVVTAKAREPLTLLPRSQRHQIRLITEKELIKKLSEGFKPFRSNGSYGLVDRIVDNIDIEIESFRLEFQTLGKFKTKRPGPWMPPLFRMEMNNLKVCMVDAEGCEGNPDQVWAHNRGRRDSFLIFKKVSGECKIQLIPQDPSYHAKEHDTRIGELVNLKIEVQLAVERRLRDGAVLACQIDVTIPEVDVDIESSDIRQLAHFASGVQYCLAKDRSFDDPLKPMDSTSKVTGPGKLVDALGNVEDKDDSIAEGIDVNTDAAICDSDANSIPDGGSVTSWNSEDENFDDEVNDSSTHSRSGLPNRSGARDEQSIMILPGNLIIYKSVSFTCSIHEVVIRGSYPCDKGMASLEFVAKGFVAEVLWPKANREHGMYAQVSTSFVSLQERIGDHKRTLLMGGMHRDDRLSRHLPSRMPQQVCADDFFPLFERRGIRDDPLDMRHLFPTQAFGLKTTVDILDQSIDNETYTFMVHHEVGIDEIDVVLDTSVLLRITRFVLDMDGRGIDPRWDTGDWVDLLTPAMLHNPSDTLHLNEYLQECTQLFLDENLMISSDLFNVTARLSNVQVRVPSVIQDSLRSSDIILKWKETTFVVSSALPRTFLTGRIGNSISGDERNDEEKGVIDFPNDHSDICYRYEQGLKGKTISTFRLQLTTRGFEVSIVPVISFCMAPEARKLVYINDSTLIFSFEGEPPTPGCDKMKITVFLSTLIHELGLNIDFDLLAGATCTLLSHKKNITAMVDMFSEIIAQYHGASSNTCVDDESQPSDMNRIQQSMKGRRILAKRHMSQSRETGGLAIVFCLQQKEFRLTIWRQNVPISSPLRESRESVKVSKVQNDEDRIDLVALLDFEMQDLEIGIEFDFHSNSGHRTIVKSCFKKAQLKAVDLAKETEHHKLRKENQSLGSPATDDAGIDFRRYQIELCSFGNESMPCGLDPSGVSQHFAFRLEAHHKNNSQSWSMAADISAPSIIALDAEPVKNATLLVVEALLLPAWSKDLIMAKEVAPFPPGTIGGMFYSVASESVGDQGICLSDLSWLEVDTDSCDPMVERILRSLCKTFLPSNLQVILLRCEVANLLVSIPSENDDQNNNKTNLCFLLDQADMITRFYPNPESPPSEIEQVLACKGTDWSTLINTSKGGFYQSILSRQGLLSMREVDKNNEVEILVHPFEISLAYSGAEVDLSMSKGISVDDIRLIENIQSRLRSSIHLTSKCFSEVHSVLAALVYRIQTVKLSPSLPVTSLDTGKLNGKISTDREPSVICAMRKILKKTNEEFSVYENLVRDNIQRKNNELESMKLDLFIKERERFGALSMMSSHVAGWVRMGSQHSSGQRVLKKSLLWPFWAVLRRELLLLYPRPGDPKPSDVVSLVNARIRKVAGGSSKQDTKRAFAVLESSGVTRYFVAGNAQEYELWTNEINSTIMSFSNTTKLANGENDIDNGSLEPLFDEIDDDEEPITGDSQRSGIGDRLSSAFQSARIKTKEMSDRRHSTVSTDQGEHSSIFSSATLGDSEVSEVSFLTPGKSRGDISKKFSGVGQATKTKFGSALQNVRQKREEITHRLRMEDGQASSTQGVIDGDVEEDRTPRSPLFSRKNSSSTDVNPDGSRGSGLGSKLQFGNKLGSAINNARMMTKGNVEKQGRLSNFRGKLGVLAQSQIDDKTELQSHSNDGTTLEDQQNSRTCTECSSIKRVNRNQDEADVCSTCSSTRKVDVRQIENPPNDTSTLAKGAIENAVEPTRDSVFSDTARSLTSSFRSRDTPNQDEKSRRSSRFSFRKRQDGPLNDSLFSDDLLTLKNIYVDAGVTPGGNVVGETITPLKILREKWIVNVTEVANIIKPEDENGMIASVHLSESDSTRNSISASNRDMQLQRSNDDDVTQSGIGEVHATNNERVEADAPCFVIKTMQVQYEYTEVPVEKRWTFGDVLKLYTEISDAIENDLPQLLRRRSFLWDENTTPLVAGSSGTTVVENMMVYGRILGGLLSAGEFTEDVKGLGKYQCESIENFLNSLLECPLPVDALSLLSETLGIIGTMVDIGPNIHDSSSGISENEPCVIPAVETCVHLSDPNGPLEKVSNKSSDSPDTRGGAIFSLLSACEAELHKAETKILSLDFCQQVGETTKVADEPSPVQIQPIFNEPLLPLSLTDHVHHSVHEALMSVTAERDEAYAQLIGANVMHTHSLERMRKKNERLEIAATLSQEIARIHVKQDLQGPTIANMFGKPDLRGEKIRDEIDRKIERVHHIIRSDDGDAEMMQLCHQLGAEISTKTSYASEIERIKEIREVEKKTETAEKDALKEEIKRVKELLEIERKKNAEACANAAHWKSLYEECQK